jgi:hypothetical protein
MWLARLRGRGFRRVFRPMAPALLGIGLLGVALWQAVRVLPVDGAPTTSPAAVAAELPSHGVHSTSNGYVLSLTLTVKDCSQPVSVFAEIVLPREYFALESAEAITTVRKALVGLAVDDPGVKMMSMVESGWQVHRQRLGFPHWRLRFNKSLLVGGTGRAEVLRLDDWQSHPSEVDVWFSAKWLSPRGYGSCWLRLPAITGGDAPNVAINSADTIDATIGPRSGATNTGEKSGGSSTVHVYQPDGGTRTYHESEPEHVDYVEGIVPPSVGYITLISPMSLIAGESTVPTPAVGVPRWACGTQPHQSILDLMDEAGNGEGGLRYSDPPTLHSFPVTSPFDCSGVVALSEPGAQSRHDLLLLIIGGVISLGGGLIVESALRRSRRASSQPAPEQRLND